jgi:hypothetical protein
VQLLKLDGPPYFPASDRQQRVHAGAVDRLRDVLAVRPVELPGFGTVVMVEPWLQLNAMTPSFMRLPPNRRARAVYRDRVWRSCSSISF